MRHHHAGLFAAAVLSSMPVTSAMAQEGANTYATPEVIKQLIDCRAIADTARRLACYDQRTAALAQAQQSGELVVADKQEIRKERRGLFGLSLPRLKIFGGDDDKDEVKEVTATVASASRGRSGGLIFDLGDNGTWEQTDTTYVNTPKPGETLVITRGVLTNYFARLNNRVGFRIKRLR